MAVKKDDLNKLIQQLPQESLPIAESFLKKLVNESKKREIPEDDEPLTQDDLQAIKEAKEAFARGEGIKFEDIKDELLH